MGPFDDIDLERTESWSASPPRASRRGLIAGAGLAIVLAGAGLAWWMLGQPAPSPHMERLASSVTAAPPPAPVAAARPIASELPALDALDPVIRELINELTASPLLARWLGTEHLARQIAALVEAAAGGGLPWRLLAPLRPSGAFSVVERGGRTTIAPASYARYDALADAIVALDPAAVVRAYRRLAPRLEEAHAELGEGARTFDAALGDSLRRLAETPIPDGPVAVTVRGGVYEFADPKLETLSPVQKLLLRSGPANARRVQAQLGAIAEALRTPAEATP